MYINQILKPLQDYFYPQPIPIPEPMPMPVQVQPEEEIQNQYSIWIPVGVGVAAIVMTIALKIFCSPKKLTPAEEMFKACDSRDEITVRRLLDGGFNPNIRNSTGKSLLDIAIEQDNSQLIALLAPIVDLNKPNNIGERPLHLAAKKGDTQLIDLLVQNGARVELTTKAGKTPLYYAVENNKLEAAKALLAHNADIHQTPNATSLFEVALNAGHKDIALLLLEKIDVKKANNFGETPLHLAARLGDQDVLDFIIIRGADVNAKNGKKETPLFCAVQFNKLENVKTLLSHYANVYLTPDETSLFEVALNKGHKDMALLLLEKIDVKKANSMGETPLHFAAQKGDKKLIEKLLEMGADVNAKTASGKTPLSYAVESCQVTNVGTLLKAKADPNIATDRGYFPIHAACKNYATHKEEEIKKENSIAIIELLVNAGAIVDGEAGHLQQKPIQFANNDPQIELLFSQKNNIKEKNLKFN